MVIFNEILSNNEGQFSIPRTYGEQWQVIWSFADLVYIPTLPCDKPLLPLENIYLASLQLDKF